MECPADSRSHQKSPASFFLTAMIQILWCSNCKLTIGQFLCCLPVGCKLKWSNACSKLTYLDFQSGIAWEWRWLNSAKSPLLSEQLQSPAGSLLAPPSKCQTLFGSHIVLIHLLERNVMIIYNWQITFSCFCQCWCFSPFCAVAATSEDVSTAARSISSCILLAEVVFFCL